MKMKNVFFKYAVWGAWLVLSACTASMEDALDENTSGILAGGVSAGRRPMEMLIRNKLVPADASTKADGSIALASENEVTAMDIYVFGSETENGTYTFQERLSYRAGEEGETSDGVTPFVLVTNGSDNALSTAKLSIKKGLFVKLYCVANAPQLYALDEEQQTYEPAVFQPLVTEQEDGQVKLVTPGSPTEAEFLSDYTAHVINPANPEDVLATPLLMRGNVTGCVDLSDYSDNSTINTSMKLVRGVARFDVHNVADESGLTIMAVGMSDGNATTALFPFDARPAADGSFITYPWKYFPGGTSENINTGTQLGAFYSYAAPADACLLLQGNFKTAAGESVPVNYRVPFNSLEDGEGNKITIQPNHRYTVKVNEADPYQIKLAITVADWEEGGSLDDLAPDDEEAGGLSELTTETVKNISNSYVYDNKSYFWVAMYANSAGDKFSVKLSSNSAIKCQMKFGDGDTQHKWLDVKCAESKATTRSTWSTDYTFTFSVNADAVSSTNKDKAFPSVLVNFISAGGETRTIRVESLTYTLDGSGMTNASKYDDEYWYFEAGSGNWSTAMSTCPQEDGWYLPGMNDFRNFLRVNNWDTVELPLNSQAYNNVYDNTSGFTSSYTSQFVSASASASDPTCTSQSDVGQYKSGSGSASNYYWSSDVSDASRARGVRFYVYRTVRHTCSYGSYWGYGSDGKYGQQYGYHISSSSSSNYTSYYNLLSQTSSYKIRCVKRRPGHPVYPY